MPPYKLIAIMRPLYNDEVIELEQFLDLILHPEKYGCSFDTGDRATYQERAGHIIDAASATITSLRSRHLVRNLLGAAGTT